MDFNFLIGMQEECTHHTPKERDIALTFFSFLRHRVERFCVFFSLLFLMQEEHTAPANENS